MNKTICPRLHKNIFMRKKIKVTRQFRFYISKLQNCFTTQVLDIACYGPDRLRGRAGRDSYRHCMVRTGRGETRTDRLLLTCRTGRNLYQHRLVWTRRGENYANIACYGPAGGRLYQHRLYGPVEKRLVLISPVTVRTGRDLYRHCLVRIAREETCTDTA